MEENKINTFTGVSIVIANMIGTGAFTSLGFQLNSLHSTITIIALWIFGGVMALSGAFSYAEIGTMVKRSGGEFALLDYLYPPIIGYLSGWISISVGFAAPVAMSIIAFMEYLPISVSFPKTTGIFIMCIITAIHCKNLRISSIFQNISTSFKILFILSFIIIALIIPSNVTPISITPPFYTEITSSAFAVALIFVSYSYSGWNAAAYITNEFRNPRKSLPIALIAGTFIVTALYTLLQYSFLRHVPQSELINQINVGTITAKHILGDDFAYIYGGLISLLLISGISAMIWMGPKVTAAIAGKYKLWNTFKANSKGIPVKASWLQFCISSILLITGTFEQILVYCGILLTISSLLVVVGVFKIRHQTISMKQVFKSPLYPFSQIIFILISVWIILFTLLNNPYETLLGITNLLIGTITYFLNKRCGSNKKCLSQL